MRIFIGHDSTQALNTEVCVSSIRKYNPNVDITLLVKSELEEKYGFAREHDGSTEFTYTRFLVPLLMEYSGVALFCDSDFVWLCNPEEVLNWLNPDMAVHCVKHREMKVRSSGKMNNMRNEYYPRKWWSSLMLFNCAHHNCRKLTVEYVNSASPANLHRLVWAEDLVGGIPLEYNHLVGYYDTENTPKALHFTDGTPLHSKYQNEPFSEKYLEFAGYSKQSS